MGYLLRVSGEKECAAAKASRRVDGRLEEARGLGVGRAGSEHDRRRTAVEERLELGQEGLRLRALLEGGQWLFPEGLKKPPLFYWLGGMIAYSSERIEGSGTLVDISLSGARLEDTEVQPKIGSAVRADVYAYASANDPVRLVGEVVRHTPRGFALQFTSVDEAVRRLVFEASGESEGPD